MILVVFLVRSRGSNRFLGYVRESLFRYYLPDLLGGVHVFGKRVAIYIVHGMNFRPVMWCPSYNELFCYILSRDYRKGIDGQGKQVFMDEGDMIWI